MPDNPTIDSILVRARLELSDFGKSFQASVVGDGVTQRFDLPQQPIAADGFAAYLATDPITPLTDPTDFSLEEQPGIITLVNPVPDGVTLVTQGITYEYFTDDEMREFINTAFLKHVNDTVPPVSLDDPVPEGFVPLPDVEAHLVAILAATEAIWVLVTDAATDIDVLTPEGVSIPRTQRFAQLMALLGQLEERYRTLAEALNVGVHRIQMFNLRRVSRTTNRFVPLYVPQEVDDRTAPVRIYPPIDPGV